MTFRHRSAGGFAVAVWVVSALIAWDGLRTESYHYVGIAAIIAYLIWLAMWSPRIDADEQGIMVINPFRIYTIPWKAIDHFGIHGLFTIVLHDGELIRAWNGPMSKRPDRAEALVSAVESCRPAKVQSDMNIDVAWRALEIGAVIGLLVITLVFL